jgi:prepilin-type N-terminal cleavage/methylation domain-containing protein
MSRRQNSGFSLIELLLVVAIMGTIAGIAIPAFLGQRRRARLIGDAQANAAVLRIQLETVKADAGLYGAAGTTFTWTYLGAVSAGASVFNFTPKGNSRMNYSVSLPLAGSGLTYNISVTDPTLGHNGTVVFTTNQNGSGVITPY